MNIVNKIMVLFSMIIISGSVLGQTMGANTEQVGQNRMITEIRTYDTYAVIKYQPSEENSLCAGALTSRWAVIELDANNSSVLLDNALAAADNGNYIGLGIEGDGNAAMTTTHCSNWGGGVPVVYRLDIVD